MNTRDGAVTSAEPVRTRTSAMRRARRRDVPAAAWLAARKFAEDPLKKFAPVVAALATPMWIVSLFGGRRSLYYATGRAGSALVAIEPVERHRRNLILGVLEFAGLLLPTLLIVLTLRAAVLTRWGVDPLPGLPLLGVGVVSLLAYFATMWAPYPGRIWREGPRVDAQWRVSLAAANYRAGLLTIKRQIASTTGDDAVIETAARDERLVDVYSRQGFERVAPGAGRMIRRGLTGA